MHELRRYIDYIIALLILVKGYCILDLIRIKKKSFAFLFKIKTKSLFLDVSTLKKVSDRTIGTKGPILNLRYAMSLPLLKFSSSLFQTFNFRCLLSKFRNFNYKVAKL